MATDGVALVTGSSSGIGAAVAARMAAAGYRVFGASRRGTSAVPGVVPLPLDVRDEAAVERCVAGVLERAGRLDVLVNNAGVMLFGPVEEVPVDGARAIFETNFWGVARMVNAALPALRAAGGGHVINVGSIAGRVAVPMNGYYAASKHALVAYSEALRHEVRGCGIRVALVEPGDVRTDLWEGAPVVPGRFASYEGVRRGVLRSLAALRSEALEPSEVADAVLRVAADDDPPLRVPVGAMARKIAAMRAWMPAKWFEAGTRRRFGLDEAPAPSAR
jgi:NAD(P)-dependent dehydrogenase (short-subunit alcohol dehydrogenase family)